MEPIIFVTGNKNKLREVQSLFGNTVNFTNERIDLPELQEEPEAISKEKAILAFKKMKEKHGKPIGVVVEDTSLCFEALNGLPGPYIKDFLKKLGLVGLNKILAGFDNKTAYAQCIVSYMDGDMKEPKTFIGRVKGSIVQPTGNNNFGWDPIFLPSGYKTTYAEMEQSIKNKISHRTLAFLQFKDFILNKNKK